MEHTVVSVEPVNEYPYNLITVTCTCGYYQQKTRMNYMAELWLADALHMLWAEQNPLVIDHSLRGNCDCYPQCYIDSMDRGD